MLQRSACLLVVTIVVPIASAHGQPPQRLNVFDDLVRVCDKHGRSELVFVGRAETPVTFRISGEAEIEKARQHLTRTEAEVARLSASLDPRTRWEREAEFELKISEAKAELATRQSRYPPPYELTLVPVLVEQTFRGVVEPRLMLQLLEPSIRMELGESYLIDAQRSRAMIPPIPTVWDPYPIAEYAYAGHVTPVGLARQELQLLAATTSGATIFGNIRRQSHGETRGTPLGGVRLVVSSETQHLGAMTREDGRFMVTGISPGRLVVRPRLAEDLAVVNDSALTFTVGEGECRTLELRVELNGRVLGRILSTTSNPLGDVELTLRGVSSHGFRRSPRSPRVRTRPDGDGTFEFSGVPPGSYILSARVEKIEEGKKRSLTTFYPGTRELATAVPIVVGRATRHDGFDFLVVTE